MLKSNFWIIKLGPCTYYLEMIVIRNWQQKQIELRKLVYLERLLKKLGMWECKPVVVSIDT